MTTTKMTKAQKFAMLKAIPEVAQNEMLVEFIDHELELLAKKNVSATGEKKLTATQKMNEGIKVAILNHMTTGQLYTVSDFIKSVPECEGFNTSKVSALVTQLKNEGKVNRSEVKGRAYFSKT